MKLYQWLTRGFHNGKLVEAGEQVICDDSVIPGPHMLDVATGLRGGQVAPAPVAPKPPPSLPRIMDLMAEMGANYPRVIAPDGRLLVFRPEHGAYDYMSPPAAVPDPPSNVVKLAVPPPPIPPEPIPAPANDPEPAVDTAPSEMQPEHDTPELAATAAAVGETTDEVGDGEVAPPG